MRVDDPVSPEHLSPYERLFLEAMSGQSQLFVRDDEVEEMWNIIQPVADAWADNVVPLQSYPAGSNGPPREDPGALTEHGHSRTTAETPGSGPFPTYH